MLTGLISALDSVVDVVVDVDAVNEELNVSTPSVIVVEVFKATEEVVVVDSSGIYVMDGLLALSVVV